MILIKKDPNKYENLVNKITKYEYQCLVNFIDLDDLMKFIESLYIDNWVPNCYWKVKDPNEKVYIGQMEWAIYSYLIDRKLLVIENRYYLYNQSEKNKYLLKTGYYNVFEEDIYIPIIDRLEKSGYLDKYIETILGKGVTSYSYKLIYYKLGKSHCREDKLNKLLEYE